MSEFKAIDFHIHTLHTVSDNKEFVFDIDRLKEYVSRLELKAIAITNHNCFDKGQFEEITKKLANNNVVVFPGVELDLDGGHIIVIAPPELMNDFAEQCNSFAKDVLTQNFSMSVEDFNNVFGDFLDDYLLIPHYKKNPSIRAETIKGIRTKIIAGEVQNPKKFELIKKDVDEQRCPVMFSDIRMSELDENEVEPAPKIMYIKIDEINVPNLKIALSDKTNVALTKSGDDDFIIDSNFTVASLKLNVIMGKRSSGKTFLLDNIAKIYGNDDTLYIKQFDIINQCDDDSFGNLIKSKYMSISEEYLSGVKMITEAVLKADDENYISSEIDKYLESLMTFAKNSSLQTVYSKTKLYKAIEFSAHDDIVGSTILNNLVYLINHASYSETINNNIKLLKEMFLDILSTHKEKQCRFIIEKEANDIIRTTKKKLEEKASISPPREINLYRISKSIIVNKKFDDIIERLRSESELKDYETSYGRFKIKVVKNSFKNVSVLQDTLKTNTPHQDIFKQYYSCPHKFVRALSDSNNFSKPHLIYRALIKIDVKPVKQDGHDISKGERAEFVLMQKLEDARNCRLFLFDEPEPSFDNPFIGDDIVKQLKDLSASTTVFVVTHNSTLGASMSPDSILYTSEDSGTYKTYVGSLTSDELVSHDGSRVKIADVLIPLLEASEDHYEKRKELYEIIKNR